MPARRPRRPRHLLGNDLVREARRRARLTQRELAERAGTTQSAIARLENGHTAPSLETVLYLVRECGLDLDVMLVERDRDDMWQAEGLLELTPGARAERHQRIVEQMQSFRRAGAGTRNGSA